MSSVELSGTLSSKNAKTDFGGLGPAPISLGDFYARKPRNDRFRSVSDQEKKTEPFLLPDGGEILDGSG